MTGDKPAHGALDTAYIGLYPAGNFYLTLGGRAAGTAIAQALWYFAGELLAIPRGAFPGAGFGLRLTAVQDIVQWSQAHPPGAGLDYPPLVWIASPHLVRGARLAAGGVRLEADDETWTFSVVARIALNRSYYDATSVAFFSARALSVRGTVSEGRFTARTLWPDDFCLDSAAPTHAVDADGATLRALVRGEPLGGAQSPFAATTLWERHPGDTRRWHHRPVLALVLNGAQGDDDEAHGGHFALATGRVGENGAIGDLLTNNFYALDAFSEKGIIAAPVTLDAYLADLNSGQAWYRPSYLVVAILADDRAAAQVQSALGRVYNQLYRHQLAYRHASMNCAGISIDVLRALGWKVRVRGPTSRLLAALGFPYFALRDRSMSKAIEAGDYLSVDRTRLLPAVAFEEIGDDLLRMAQGTLLREATAFESMLASDIEALVFLRIPQLPSSRTWGDFPVATVAEYTARMPSDPAEAKIIPVPPRPFPAGLRDDDLLPPPLGAGEWIAMAWALISVVGIPWVVRRIGRRRRAQPRG